MKEKLSRLLLVAMVFMLGMITLEAANKVAVDFEGTGLKTANKETVAELRSALEGAKDGSIIEIGNGIYRDLGRVNINANNLTVRAKEQGKVRLSGTVQLLINGNENTIDGMIFIDGGAVIAPKPDSTKTDITGVVGIYGEKNTFKNSVICNFNDYECVPNEKGKYPNVRWVTIGGVENSVVNNTFEGKFKRGAILVVQTSNKLEKSLIEGNVFKEIKPWDLDMIKEGNPKMARTNKNDRQAIRLGDSKNSQYASGSIIRNNYFEEIDGELELMSIKACDVLIEGNTVRSSQSMISLRHGSGNTVRGNVVLGDGKERTGGIRFYDEDHIIENNYVEGTLGYGNMRGGIAINTGVNDVLNGEKLDQNTKGKELKKQWTPKNILIKNNTLIDNAQGILISDKKHKVSLTNDSKVEMVYSAVGVKIEGNLVIAEKEGTKTLKGAEEDKFALVNPEYKGNVFFGNRTGMEELGVEEVTSAPALTRVDGILVSSDMIGAKNVTLLSEETTGANIKLN